MSAQVTLVLTLIAALVYIGTFNRIISTAVILRQDHEGICGVRWLAIILAVFTAFILGRITA